MKNLLRNIRAPLALSLALGAGVASAQTATDYSGILAGLDSSTAITAIVGAGAILAGVGFAKWATKKVARFFG